MGALKAVMTHPLFLVTEVGQSSVIAAMLVRIITGNCRPESLQVRSQSDEHIELEFELNRGPGKYTLRLERQDGE